MQQQLLALMVLRLRYPSSGHDLTVRMPDVPVDLSALQTMLSASGFIEEST